MNESENYSGVKGLSIQTDGNNNESEINKKQITEAVKNAGYSGRSVVLCCACRKSTAKGGLNMAKRRANGEGSGDGEKANGCAKSPAIPPNFLTEI